MENYSLSILITQGITIILLLVLIVYLVRQRRMIRLAKRFEKFSLLSNKEKESSFFDLVMEYVWKFIHSFSKLLSKSAVMKKYGERYDKFISFEEKDKISGIDYVAIKFSIGFLFFILNIVSMMFQVMNLSVISLLVTFLVGFFLPDVYLQILFHEKRKRIEEDLLKAIIMMNNSFKSGRNIMQAVEIVKNELEGPISDEFKKIYLDMTYGLSMEVVFDRF